MKKISIILILLLSSLFTIGQNIRHDQLKEPNKETSDTVLFFIPEVNGYWRIGKGVFNNVTPIELTDSLNVIRENHQRNLDTIIWDATKYDLDSLNSVLSDSIGDHRIEIQILKDSVLNCLRYRDTVTVLATKYDIKDFATKPAGIFRIIPVTTSSISVTYPNVMSFDDYWLEIEATYNISRDGKTVPIDNGIYDVVKTRTGFTCKVNKVEGVLKYMAMDSIDIMISEGFPAETDPIFLESLAYDITKEDTTRWGTNSLTNNSVTNVILNDMAESTIKGRYTTGTGDPEDLNSTQVKTILSLNNVENTALSTWGGSSNISTVGTITSGAWNGNIILDPYVDKSGNWTGTFDGQQGSYYLNFNNLTNRPLFGTGVLTWLATPNSQNLLDALTDEVGVGSVVFHTNPTLNSPRIDNISAMATNSSTELYTVVTTGSISLGQGLTTGTLDIASAGTGSTPIRIGHTNATTTITGSVKLPTVGTSGLVTLGTGGILSSKATTGSGNVVLATSPALSTPILGAATATSINKVTITAPASSATLTLANTSTLATSGAHSITLTSTGTTNVTLPTSGTLATTSIVEDNITDGATTTAPSENAVYDALALKLNEPTVQTLTYNVTNTTMDVTNGTDAIVTLTGNITTLTMSNVKNGGEGQIAVIQNATGGYGISAIAHTSPVSLTVKYINSTAPTSSGLNSTANGHSIISYKRLGSYLYVTYGKF